jgi:hypothetical protein
MAEAFAPAQEEKMQLCKFTTTERTTVYLNPQLVRAVSHHSATIARIQFDKDHFILVNDQLETVSQIIEQAWSA